MIKNYFFIINPVNHHKAKSLEMEIHSFFLNKKDKYQIKISKNEKHLKKLAAVAIDLNVDVIIACGGDGTVSKIGQIIINKKVKLGIIPIGSGNGISSHFDIPYNFRKALKLIVKGKSKKMDIGKVGNKYFFSNIGFGIEVEFIRYYTQAKTHGLLGYFPAFLKSLTSYKSSNFSIKTLDQQVSIKPYVLMVSNTNKQGYGISLSPKAKTDDGFLNIIIISKTNILNLLYLFVLVLFGFSIENKKNVKYLESRKFKIISENHKMNIQIDGEFEILNKNELNISVLPKAIDVLC